MESLLKAAKGILIKSVVVIVVIMAVVMLIALSVYIKRLTNQSY